MATGQRAKCAFAHDKSELKHAPNLWKTRLCRAFEKGLCRNGAACTFAHGKQELIRADLFYKKTLCSWFEKGRCRNGDRCCFAHGADELRGPRTPSELSGSAQRKMHVTSSLSVSTTATEHAVVEDADSATDSWDEQDPVVHEPKATGQPKRPEHGDSVYKRGQQYLKNKKKEDAHGLSQGLSALALDAPRDAHGLSHGLSALALDAPRGRLSPAAAILPLDVSYVSPGRAPPGAFFVPPGRAFFAPPGAPSPEFTANSALMTPMKIHSSLVLG